MKTPSVPGQVSDTLRQQNPWFDLGLVPPTLAPPTERKLVSLLASQVVNDVPRRFQRVLGPRRVGKTTTMYQVVKRLLDEGVPKQRLCWLRLDHPSWMDHSLEAIVGALVRSRRATLESPTFLFLDELNYAESWDLWLKTFYDDRWPVRVVATSSSTAALRERRMESGVGRWEEQHLPPWLFPEYLRMRGAQIPTGAASLADGVDRILERPPVIEDVEAELKRYLLIGGFPELLALPAEDQADELLRSQRVLRADAVERAIYKDIPQVFSVTEPMKLEKLLYILAGQFTGLLSPSTLATDLGLTQPTIDKYLRYLEQAFLVFTLPNYSSSEEAVQRRGRKLYFWDGAVRNAALQRGIRPRNDEGEMGHLRENAVAAHLRALAEQTGVRLYHWRDGKHEVDLIYDDPERPLAFEIGSSIRHNRAALLAFQRRFPRFRGRCFLVAPAIDPQPPAAVGDGIGHLPLDQFLTMVGVAAEAAQVDRLSAVVTR